MNWIIEHWKDIAAVYGALVALCTIIVHLTPSQKDDAILAKIVGWLNVLSTVNPKKPV